MAGVTSQTRVGWPLVDWTYRHTRCNVGLICARLQPRDIAGLAGQFLSGPPSANHETRAVISATCLGRTLTLGLSVPAKRAAACTSEAASPQTETWHCRRRAPSTTDYIRRNTEGCRASCNSATAELPR